MGDGMTFARGPPAARDILHIMQRSDVDVWAIHMSDETFSYVHSSLTPSYTPRKHRLRPSSNLELCTVQ